jgi:penicillin amidase
MVRMLNVVYDDELNTLGFYRPSINFNLRTALVHLLEAKPTELATYDAKSGDSSIFDDLNTPNVVETRDERIVTALLDALDYLQAKLGADRSMWRWGALHAVRFQTLVPLWPALTFPALDDATFPRGFPRAGDQFTVDVGNYNSRPDTYSLLAFDINIGPVQRLVVDLDPAGPVAFNAIPGGAIWDNTSPHFRDEAELWRRDQRHRVPFLRKDVDAAAELHVTFKQ